MRVVVDHDNISEVLAHLRFIKDGVISLDTESYGLKWDDKLFALQLAIKGGDSFYFNFHEYNDGSPVLSRAVFAELHDLWKRPNIRWVIANAKYDMRRLEIEGVILNGEIYDILLMERIRFNRYMSYSLDACLKRLGLAKNDEVKQWITKNKAYTTYHVEGKKTKEKDLHYDRVPYSLMVRYGFDDVEGNLVVYEDQAAYFELPENKEQIKLVHSNLELVKAVYAMESTGIQLDINYCKRKLAEENALIQEKYSRIEKMTNMKFKSGPLWLEELLESQGIKLDYSDKGNPILDKHALKSMPSAVAQYIIEVRDHEKRAGTYSTLLRFADSSGVLHTNYRLNGTDTLRFSSSDPNLQNIEACEKGNLETIRSAFVPRTGFGFLSIDYKAMEYRLVADLAGELSWVHAINNGADPHQFVADMMGVERTPAKTLNFMLLYGGGLAKLALALFPMKTDEDTLKALCKVHLYNGYNITDKELYLASQVSPEIVAHEIEYLRQAEKLKKLYFKSLPAVEGFTKQVQDIAKERGYLRNQFGARYFLDNKQYSYKMPNHLIQGTGACTIRGAIVKLHHFLEGYRTRMLLQLHDEILLELAEGEEHIIPEIVRIMENEYRPINGMFLKCDVEYSKETWNANQFKNWRENES